LFQVGIWNALGRINIDIQQLATVDEDLLLTRSRQCHESICRCHTFVICCASWRAALSVMQVVISHAATQVGCSAAYLAAMITTHKLKAPDHMASSQSQALLQSQPAMIRKLLGQVRDLLWQMWGEAGSKGQRAWVMMGAWQRRVLICTKHSRRRGKPCRLSKSPCLAAVRISCKCKNQCSTSSQVCSVRSQFHRQCVVC